MRSVSTIRPFGNTVRRRFLSVLVILCVVIILSISIVGQVRGCLGAEGAAPKREMLNAKAARGDQDPGAKGKCSILNQP
jgi:hypothetical protein